MAAASGADGRVTESWTADDRLVGWFSLALLRAILRSILRLARRRFLAVAAADLTCNQGKLQFILVAEFLTRLMIS